MGGNFLEEQHRMMKMQLREATLRVQAIEDQMKEATKTREFRQREAEAKAIFWEEMASKARDGKVNASLSSDIGMT